MTNKFETGDWNLKLIIVHIALYRSLRGAEVVARRSRSNPGDSSLRSEQAPQSQGEIATPLGLAMTTFRDS